MTKKAFRWRYYIDKKFQNRFIWSFSGVVVLVTVFSLAILWLLRENPYGLLPNRTAVLVDIDASRGLLLSKVEDKKSGGKEKKRKKKSTKKSRKTKKKEVLYAQNSGGSAYFPVKVKDGILLKYNAFDLYWMPMLIFSGSIIFVIILFGLFFSHKLAGPIYRIQKALEQYISTGTMDYVKLRKNDHFGEIGKLINEAYRTENSSGELPSTNSESTKDV